MSSTTSIESAQTTSAHGWYKVSLIFENDFGSISNTQEAFVHHLTTELNAAITPDSILKLTVSAGSIVTSIYVGQIESVDKILAAVKTGLSFQLGGQTYAATADQRGLPTPDSAAFSPAIFDGIQQPGSAGSSGSSGGPAAITRGLAVGLGVGCSLLVITVVLVVAVMAHRRKR